MMMFVSSVLLVVDPRRRILASSALSYITVSETVFTVIKQISD